MARPQSSPGSPRAMRCLLPMMTACDDEPCHMASDRFRYTASSALQEPKRRETHKACPLLLGFAHCTTRLHVIRHPATHNMMMCSRPYCTPGGCVVEGIDPLHAAFVAALPKGPLCRDAAGRIASPSLCIPTVLYTQPAHTCSHTSSV